MRMYIQKSPRGRGLECIGGNGQIGGVVEVFMYSTTTPHAGVSRQYSHWATILQRISPQDFPPWLNRTNWTCRLASGQEVWRQR